MEDSVTMIGVGIGAASALIGAQIWIFKLMLDGAIKGAVIEINKVIDGVTKSAIEKHEHDWHGGIRNDKN